MVMAIPDGIRSHVWPKQRMITICAILGVTHVQLRAQASLSGSPAAYHQVVLLFYNTVLFLDYSMDYSPLPKEL